LTAEKVDRLLNPATGFLCTLSPLRFLNITNILLKIKQPFKGGTFNEKNSNNQHGCFINFWIFF